MRRCTRFGLDPCILLACVASNLIACDIIQIEQDGNTTDAKGYSTEKYSRNPNLLPGKGDLKYIINCLHPKYVKDVTYLDFVLAVQLVVVQSVLCDGCAAFVQILDEGDVLLRRNKTDFVQIGISDDNG